LYEALWKTGETAVDNQATTSDSSRVSGDDLARTRELAPRIESDPHILHGKPIVQGTRLSVESIFENLAGGYSLADLLDAYPFLTQDDRTAVFRYAARQFGDDIPADHAASEETKVAS